MKNLYNEKYLEKKKKWITMYYGESYNAKTKIEERLAKLRKLRGTQGRTQDFKLGGGGPEISEKKNSNTHSYSINKLSTKTNTQKSLFLNILRYNHLLTKTKDTKHYCFFI